MGEDTKCKRKNIGVKFDANTRSIPCFSGVFTCQPNNAQITGIELEFFKETEEYLALSFIDGKSMEFGGTQTFT